MIHLGQCQFHAKWFRRTYFTQIQQQPSPGPCWGGPFVKPGGPGTFHYRNKTNKTFGQKCQRAVPEPKSWLPGCHDFSQWPGGTCKRKCVCGLRAYASQRARVRGSKHLTDELVITTIVFLFFLSFASMRYVLQPFRATFKYRGVIHSPNRTDAK